MEEVGFEIVRDFHFAWLCYPLFWIKKKWNRFVGGRISQEEKLKRTQADIDSAMASPIAIWLMNVETFLGRWIHPAFGVREFVVGRKI